MRRRRRRRRGDISRILRNRDKARDVYLTGA